MPASKTTGDSKEKRSSQAKPRYYVLKTAADARSSLDQKVKAYNRKLIAEPIEEGKRLVKDLKAAPRKTVAKLVADGKMRMTDLNKDARKRIDGLMKEGQHFVAEAGRAPRKTFDSLVADGKTLVDDLRSGTQNRFEELLVDLKIVREGVAQDVRLVMSDVVDGSKEMLDQVPGKQQLEKKVVARVEAIPAALNLPSKKDVERLARQVKTLNTKVNKLSKTQAA